MADTPIASQADPMADGPVALSRRSAMRAEAATQFVEHRNRTTPPPASNGPRGAPTSALIAKLTTSCGPRSGATPGTGTITLQTFGSGTLANDTLTGLTVYNLTDKTIATGSYIFVAWAYGQWWVAVPGSCSNLS